MSSVLRIAAAIGLIFYLSPARQAPEAPLSLRGSSGRSADPLSKLPVSSGTTVEALWLALPNSAKQALGERLLAGSSHLAPSRRAQSPMAGRDTLALGDMQPPWQGEGSDDVAADLLSRERPDARRPARESHGRAKRPGAERWRP